MEIEKNGDYSVWESQRNESVSLILLTSSLNIFILTQISSFWNLLRLRQCAVHRGESDTRNAPCLEAKLECGNEWKRKNAGCLRTFALKMSKGGRAFWGRG